VIVAIVAVLLVVNNDQQEQVKGTTEVVKTTKEDKTTISEKETSETETETLTENTEEVAEPTPSTTKAPETTKKPASNSSGGSNTTTQKPVTTTKPATTKPTTIKQETTTIKPPSTTIDINTVISYPFNYCKYCSYKLTNVKPNAYMTCPSCTNQITDDRYGGKYCVDCGKNKEGKYDEQYNWIPPHQIGGCSRFSMNTKCTDCDKIIPAYTCFHGCGISH
jgi:hypothetical protein